jgi:predicted  nucleic acid-binding Zn-ribbon protein
LKAATKDKKKQAVYDKEINSLNAQVKKAEDASKRINSEIEGVNDAKKRKNEEG